MSLYLMRTYFDMNKVTSEEEKYEYEFWGIP